MPKTITLLGSTGSIGTQSLDVARMHGYRIFGLAANSRVEILQKQIEEFHPEYVAVVDPAACEKLDAALAGTANAPKLLKGPEGLRTLAAMDGPDVVLNAVVGIAGLPASLAAIESGHDLALANKESLVTGGPNWNMGAKITIDSATLMNKGLELIEAVWLFGLPEDKIQIVVQRESIVHSAVQFADHSVIAQLGVPDMRIPIQYALTWPDRLPSPVPELDFAALKHLSFDVADDETFRCLAAAKKAIRKGGLGPCAANGANEEAVRLFLQDKIGFLDIGRLVEGMVDSDSFGGDYTLQDVYDCDRMARDYVKAHV